MSILFASANGVIDSTPVATYPFTLACWFWTDAAAHEAPIIGLFNSTTGTDWATLGIGGGKVQLRCRSSASNQVLESAAAYTTGAWHAVVAVFESANLRSLYVDSAAAVTQTTAVTPAGLNRIGFGRYLDSTPSGNYAGRSSHIALWNAALTAKEAAQFTGRQSPFSIRSSALLSLWDGRSSNPGRDLRGKRAPTWTSIASHDSEPPVSALLQIYSGVTKPQVPANAGLFLANDNPIVETRTPVVLAAGKGQLFDFEIDPTTRTAKVRVNGGAWQSAGYQETLQAVTGNAIIGLPLVDGVPTGTNNNFLLNSLALFSRPLTAAEWDTVHGEMGKMIPPIVPNVTVNATVGHVSDLKLLEDAEDAAGEGLKIVSVTQPAGAAVTIKDADAGIVSYDAKSLPTGTKNSFSFTVTNKFFKPTTATATCNVTVAALQPPVLTEATLTPSTSTGTAITLDALENATDPAGRSLTITSVSTPTQGGTAAITSGKIVFTPKAGFSGTDTFTYTIKNDWNAAVTGNVSVSVAAAATVLKAYRMIGKTSPGGQQGDISSDPGCYYRLTAPTTGKLTRLTWQTQGARANEEWHDGHSEWPYGLYDWIVHKADGAPKASLGAKTKLGQTKRAFYPGWHRGGFNGTVIKPTDEAGAANSAGDNNLAGEGDLVDGLPPIGAKMQSWNHMVAEVKIKKDASSAPSFWKGNPTPVRYAGAGWPLVEIYDSNGNLGVDVTVGDILVLEYKNKGSGNSHENSCHCNYGPVPGVSGINTPMDPALGSFNTYTSGTRDFRKVPHFGVEISGAWYGQPHMLTQAVSTATDEDGGAARLIYGANRWLREVFTPPAGYKETIIKVWAHFTRYTGKANYKDDGILQCRIRRATRGSSTFSQFWPTATTTVPNPWSDMPESTFVAKPAAVAGNGSYDPGPGEQKAADMTRFGEWATGDLTIEDGYHYAVEFRVSPSSTTTSFYMNSNINGYHRFQMRRVSGRPKLNWPMLWSCDDDDADSYGFNRAQISNDGGSTWSNFQNEQQIFPISLEPKA